MSKYDYLIVGAGITGATIARCLADKGKNVLVIDKRHHIAGNCYDKIVSDIPVCCYGPHIFHTNDEEVWDFVNRFTTFNDYVHRIKSLHQGQFYSFPISANMGMGRAEILDRFYKEYSEKQWHRPFDQISNIALERVPIRMDDDDRYFTDKYQGMPIGGFTPMVKRMLDGIEVELNTPHKPDWRNYAERCIFTGKIEDIVELDEPLEYLNTIIESAPWGHRYEYPIVNFADKEIPYTRATNYALFYEQTWTQKINGVQFVEYTTLNTNRGFPAYPVNTVENNTKWVKATEFVPSNITLAGRLGTYLYLNMDVAIKKALELVHRL